MAAQKFCYLWKMSKILEFWGDDVVPIKYLNKASALMTGLDRIIIQRGMSIKPAGAFTQVPGVNIVFSLFSSSLSSSPLPPLPHDHNYPPKTNGSPTSEMQPVQNSIHIRLGSEFQRQVTVIWQVRLYLLFALSFAWGSAFSVFLFLSLKISVSISYLLNQLCDPAWWIKHHI